MHQAQNITLLSSFRRRNLMNNTRLFCWVVLRAYLFVLFMALGFGSLFAQGVTTSSIAGIVTSDKGEALVAANVIAVHEPTGTRYGATTRDNGQFNMPNLKVDRKSTRLNS